MSEQPEDLWQVLRQTPKYMCRHFGPFFLCFKPFLSQLFLQAVVSLTRQLCEAVRLDSGFSVPGPGPHAATALPTDNSGNTFVPGKLIKFMFLQRKNANILNNHLHQFRPRKDILRKIFPTFWFCFGILSNVLSKKEPKQNNNNNNNPGKRNKILL